MSSCIRTFYASKSNNFLDPLEKLDHLFQSQNKKQVSLKIVLGRNGVKELPKLKTAGSLIVPPRYTLNEIEVCAASGSKVTEVSLASLCELNVSRMSVCNTNI